MSCQASVESVRQVDNYEMFNRRVPFSKVVKRSEVAVRVLAPAATPSLVAAVSRLGLNCELPLSMLYDEEVR